MNTKGQIWVETVIYTLIGLSIIGILLSIVKPVIDEKKDQLLIEQSMNLMRNIGSQVEEVMYYGAGNSRPIEIGIKKGQLSINGKEDKIEFNMDSSYMYSELNVPVTIGKIKVTTTEKGEEYKISMERDYSALNITWKNKDTMQIFQTSPIPYTISVANLGNVDDKIKIDFS